MSNHWPPLDYLGWRETCSALHLYLQIAGKYRLAHSHWLATTRPIVKGSSRTQGRCDP